MEFIDDYVNRFEPNNIMDPNYQDHLDDRKIMINRFHLKNLRPGSMLYVQCDHSNAKYRIMREDDESGSKIHLWRDVGATGLTSSLDESILTISEVRKEGILGFRKNVPYMENGLVEIGKQTLWPYFDREGGFSQKRYPVKILKPTEVWGDIPGFMFVQVP
jgi:hypothetical protein|tara:strand:- start:61 stop:543 length:483 start_codon:yes stop_codon:yes gene_type:complete